MSKLPDRLHAVLAWLRARLWDERQPSRFVVTLEDGSDVTLTADGFRVRRGRLLLLIRHACPLLRPFVRRVTAVFEAGYWKGCGLLAEEAAGLPREGRIP